ncbi:MAG: hypothetical protein QF561_06615 [Phycisphaerales bacterium]|jgi:hypothetical protein|nr:hypothetical protein [Phycisphaerales bacterium]
MTERQDSHPKMSAADVEVFDQLAAEGFDAEKLTSLEGAQRERGQAAVDLLTLLDAYPTEPPSEEEQQTLVDATMARIRRAEDNRRDRMKMDNHPVMLGRGLRFRIAEALALAAVLAMATATIWSFGTLADERSLSVRTRQNLGEIYAGLSAFKDTNGEMPVHDASVPVGNLLENGSAKTLKMGSVANGTFCESKYLRNPRRPGLGGNGFSCAVFSAADADHIGHADVILVGDRNPALAGMLSGKSYGEAMADSMWNLRLVNRPSVLFSDGSCRDLDSYDHGGDGIWKVDRANTGPTAAPIEIFLAH